MRLNLVEKRGKISDNSKFQEKSVLNTKFINVCFASSDEYVQHLCTALKSMFLNKHSDEEFNIIILEKNISLNNKKRIKSVVGETSTIRFIQVDDKLIRNNCILRTFIPHINSLVTYYRFLLADLVTENKVLYLDCDVIIRGSLWNLYNTDIDNYYIAGVRDCCESENCERLKLSKYVNAGVLLVNLSMWRRENVKEKFLQWSAENQEQIIWLDQDVLNVVLQDKILYLDNLNNAQISGIKFGLSEEFNKIAGKAVILHYVGHNKPWMNNRFKLSKYYYTYLLKTDFAYKYFLLVLSEIFSIKKELSRGGQKYVLRLAGIKITFRKEQS